MGFGPLSVSTTSLMVSSPCPLPHPLRPLLHTARETLPSLPAASSITSRIPPRFGAFPLRRRQSNRSGRSLSPAEHTACAASLSERRPDRTGPATHKKGGNFSPAERAHLPSPGACRRKESAAARA